MPKLMINLYDNLDEAKAFVLHFTNFAYFYDKLIGKFDVMEEDFRPVRTKRGEIVYHQVTPQHKLLPLHEVNG